MAVVSGGHINQAPTKKERKAKVAGREIFNSGICIIEPYISGGDLFPTRRVSFLDDFYCTRQEDTSLNEGVSLLNLLLLSSV